MKRHKHSLSHYKICSMNMGTLVPLTWYEVIPGDTIQQATSALVRVAPLVHPLMHQVAIRIHHWYVPLRLIWDDAEDFFTGGADGTSAPTHPFKPIASNITEGSLSDYLGIMPFNYVANNMNVSALPYRAYSLIWNENYRDQDLVNEVTISTASGADATTNMSLLAPAWQKDYYTTLRPWAEKGDEVHIPVRGIGKETQVFAAGGANRYEAGGITTTYGFEKEIDDNILDNSFWVEGTAAASGYPDIHVLPDDLRLASAMHRFQEARAKYGSRYVEYLKSLGIGNPSDARLQNPEYIGGGRQVVQFSEVLSTDGANTGDMKGHGISAIRTNKYRRFFEEHGIVMSCMSVLPRHIITQGHQRGWFRETKEDYFIKEFQNIGQQEVLINEVYHNPASRTTVFGYGDRYDEYKFIPSSIGGEFRATSNDWHMARDLAAEPTLNSSFVGANPTTRVYAAAGADQLYVMANHSIQARRMVL